MAVTRAHERADVWDRLDGQHVTMRRPQMADFDAWSRLRESSRAFLTPWEPAWALDELTRNGFRRRLRRYQRDVRDGTLAPFFVFRNTDNALVGGCNLNNIRRGVMQSCSIGYWVGERYRRNGYTREAVRLALAFAFGPLELHRVEAACVPSNEPSRTLLESVGFREEGLARGYLKINDAWRDHVLYAIVRTDLIS